MIAPTPVGSTGAPSPTLPAVAPHAGSAVTAVAVANASAATSPWSLRYRDPRVEDAYWRHFCAENIALLRAASLFAVVAMVLIGLGERHLYPTLYRRLWTLRYGYLVPVAVATLPLFWVRRLAVGFTQDRFVTVISVFTLLMSLGLLAVCDVLLTHHSDLTVLYLGLGYMVSLFGLHAVLRLPFAVAVWFGVGTLLGGLMVLLSRPGVTAELALTNAGIAALGNAVGLSGLYFYERGARRRFDLALRTEHERERAEALLARTLPAPVATRLKSGERPIADAVAESSVIFADIVDFDAIVAHAGPQELLQWLDRLFGAFDALALRFGVEKIKTSGARYMAVAGTPLRHPDHATAVAKLALAMRDTVRASPPVGGVHPQVRVGLHTGPLTAGVLGQSRLVYDLWGGTVNIAACMESQGVADQIQITEAMRRQLLGQFELTPRGAMDVQGTGAMETWLLEG